MNGIRQANIVNLGIEGEVGMKSHERQLEKLPTQDECKEKVKALAELLEHPRPGSGEWVEKRYRLMHEVKRILTVVLEVMDQ